MPEACVACPNGFTTAGPGASMLTDCSVPLPVELEYFKGRMEGKVVVFEWASSSESNNSFYSLQRSHDGQNFITIAKLNGRGTTRERHVYTGRDPFPKRGLNYYRLLQVDFDGTRTYSPMIVVQTTFDATVEVWPNPANGRFHVSNPDAAIRAIEVFDLQGRLLGRFDYPDSHIAILDCAQWKAGTYAIRILAENGVFAKMLKVGEN
jgi:Secretion system C-terminal sorting domain